MVTIIKDETIVYSTVEYRVQSGDNQIIVDITSVDGDLVRPKNRRVLSTTEDRLRVGIGLKRRRESLGLDQKDIAKKAGMAIGTVQNIEYNKRKVTIDKIGAYAKAVGTTVEEVLHPEIAQPLDPQWRDLHREHLDIARRYMTAFKAQRDAVELMLPDDARAKESMANLATLVIEIKAAADHDQGIIGAIDLVLEHRGLMLEVARRVDGDSTFEDRLRDLLKGRPGKD